MTLVDLDGEIRRRASLTLEERYEEKRAASVESANDWEDLDCMFGFPNSAEAMNEDGEFLPWEQLSEKYREIVRKGEGKHL